MSTYEALSLLLDAFGIFIGVIVAMLGIIVTLIIALVNKK